MKRRSDRKAGIQKEIGRIIRRKLEANGGRCLLTGEGYAIDPAHLIRQSHSFSLQSCPRNIVPLTRWAHDIFDGVDKDRRFDYLYDLYPWKCKAIIERMFTLDFYYTNRFLDRNNLNHLRR